MPVAAGALGEGHADFFEVKANEAAFVDLGVNHLVAVKAQDRRVGHAQLVGQRTGREESGFSFHALPPSSLGVAAAARISRTTSAVEMPLWELLVAIQVISSGVSFSRVMGSSKVASCMAMHDNYAISCIRKEKNSRNNVFSLGRVTNPCILAA